MFGCESEASETGLALDAGDAGAVLGRAAVHDLDGDAPAELDLLGLVHLAHAAAPDHRRSLKRPAITCPVRLGSTSLVRSASPSSVVPPDARQPRCGLSGPDRSPHRAQCSTAT